jgi:Zn-dependent metalloprotease
VTRRDPAGGVAEEDELVFRARTRAVAGVVVMVVVPLVAAGLGLAGPAIGTSGPAAGSTVQPHYRSDPYLSVEQRAVLDRLAERSTQRLAAQSWPHGRGVGRLELSVPSGRTGGGTLADHAVTFVRSHAPLWNLSAKVDLGVVSTVGAGDCSRVTLALTIGGLRVYNAAITVVLTPDGTVRGVAGHLDGRPAGKVAASRTTAQRASAAVRAFIEEKTGERPESAPPAPTEVVVDPFYLTDDGHDAGVGWLFAAEPGGAPTPGAGVVVVNGQTGAVAVAGTGVATEGATVAGCDASNPVKVFYPYILDPMTGTPALVDFGAYGRPTAGGTATERAYDLLAQPFMTSLYGDQDPRLHLRDPEQIATVGGRTTVRFTEYYGGVPVEGARVSVLLLPNGNARLVTARFVFFPHARTEASFAPADAVTRASDRYSELECGADPACAADLAAESQAHPPSTSLVILSAEIFEYTDIPSLPAGQERLAYKIEFPRRVMYWDATDSVLLYDYPAADGATTYSIRNGEADDRTEIVNGVAVPGVTPHADALRVAGWVDTVLAYYTSLGRDGFDDAGGYVDIRVRDSDDGAFWCRIEAECEVRIRMDENHTAADILAHEFTHGVIETTTGYRGGGEASALNEHYADVMASVVFPDTTSTEWLLGEDSINGTIRDLANPASLGDPEHYGGRTLACDHRFCGHTWAAVPNRAAVLIADGGVPGSAHPGLGRAALGQLSLATLESGLGGPSDLFLDDRINMLAVCEVFVADATIVGGRALTPDDCDHVRRAFATVGIDAPVNLGWTLFEYYGETEEEVVVREGLTLLNGCTMANQVLVAHDYDTGQSRSSDVTDGLSISFAGEWGADVTARGAATDPADRTVAYRLWSTWLARGVVDVLEVYQRPPGMSDEDCRRPVGTHRRTLYSTERVSEWAVFLDGHRGDQVINAGAALAAPCTVNVIRGVHYHDWDLPLLPPSTTVDEGSHGFRIRSTGAAPTGLEVNVRWWHSGVSSIKVRVVYDIFEPDNMDCLVPGLRDDP